MITYQTIVSTSNTLLKEAVKYSDFPKVNILLRKYFLRHGFNKVYSYATPETIRNAKGTFTGMRFFIKNGSLYQSFRINWKRGRLSQSASVHSLDIWNGKTNWTKANIPTIHIDFENEPSLVKVIPFIKDYLQGNVKSKDGIYEEGDINARPFIFENVEQEQFLIEGRASSREDVGRTVQNMLKAFKDGDMIKDQRMKGGNRTYGPMWMQLAILIPSLYPKLFFKKPGQGRTMFIKPKDVSKINVDKVLDALNLSDQVVKYNVSKGVKEQDAGTSGEDIEALENIEFEQALEDVKTGVKLLRSKATHSLWLAGRGGVGKTVTVLHTLREAGLKPDEDYVVVKGSASAAGVYQLFLENKNKIIVFDDSDSALADVEGRNIFKAATDTTGERKVSWNKGGKMFMSPEEYEAEGEPDDKLPRSFIFTGSVIFISNLPIRKLDPDGALRTRGFLMNVDPTNEEIFEYMEKISDKIKLEVDAQLDSKSRTEVVSLLKERKTAEKTANLRSLVRALNVRAGIEKEGGSKKEWEEFIKRYA